MARQFFSGNTIEQAVLSAASHFGLEPSEVAYKVREKKHGFIKVRRRIVIEVDPTAPRKEILAEEPQEAIQGESIAVLEKLGTKSREKKDEAKKTRSRRDESPEEDRPTDEDDAERADVDDEESWEDEDDQENEEDQEDEDEWEDDDDDEEDWEDDDDDEGHDEDREIAAFEKATDRLIDFLDIDIEYDIERRDGLFEIELSGPDSDVVTAEEGKVLEAIEHLLPRLVRGYVGHGLPCKVDCDGFRADRQQDLLDLADEAASAVREAGRGLMLEPMNPADRRVIHLALADDPTVVTESEGEGYLKRVRVLPSDAREQGADDFVEEDDFEEDDFDEDQEDDFEEEDDVEDDDQDDDEEDPASDDFEDDDSSAEEEDDADEEDSRDEAEQEWRLGGPSDEEQENDEESKSVAPEDDAGNEDEDIAEEDPESSTDEEANEGADGDDAIDGEDRYPSY